VARCAADGHRQCRRSGPLRGGVATGDPEVAATHRETRGAAPVGPHAVTNLRLQALRSTSAGRRSQAADPARRRSGWRVYPVTRCPAVPAAIAASVSRLAWTPVRLSARRSVVLPSVGTTSTDARRGPYDQGHRHRSRVPSRSDRHARRSRANDSTPCLRRRRLGTASRGRTDGDARGSAFTRPSRRSAFEQREPTRCGTLTRRFPSPFTVPRSNRPSSQGGCHGGRSTRPAPVSVVLRVVL